MDLLDQALPLLLQGPTRHRRWDRDQRLNPAPPGCFSAFFRRWGAGASTSSTTRAPNWGIETGSLSG